MSPSARWGRGPRQTNLRSQDRGSSQNTEEEAVLEAMGPQEGRGHPWEREGRAMAGQRRKGSGRGATPCRTGAIHGRTWLSQTVQHTSSRTSSTSMC